LGAANSTLKRELNARFLDCAEKISIAGGLPMTGANIAIMLLGLFLACDRSGLTDTPGRQATGLLSGVRGSIAGLDHVLAILAVGLWSAEFGSPALWLLPITFLLVTTCWAVIPLRRVTLPSRESCSAFSVIALGTAMSLQSKPNLWALAVMLAAFAVAHDHAPASDVATGTSTFLYNPGFLVATSLLTVMGVFLGFMLRWTVGQFSLRFTGTLIVVAGSVFLWRAVMTGHGAQSPTEA